MKKQEITAMVTQILEEMNLREPAVKASDYHPRDPGPQQGDTGYASGDFVPDVSQLMNHHIFNGLAGILHQPKGEGQPVFGTAGAKSCPCTGDGDACRPDFHQRSIMLHQRRQQFLCLPAQ